MAINTQGGNNGNAINIRYSAFLGMLYVVNDGNLNLIKEARDLVGEDNVKKGFDGDGGNSAKARRFLADHGIRPITVDGALAYVNVDEREVNGGKQKYLTVGLRDGAETFFVSLDFGSEAAQGLVRKLAQAEFGKLTRIGVYGFYEQSERNGQYYGAHRAGLKQGNTVAELADKENKGVRGVDPTPLSGKVKAATEALSEALSKVGQSPDGKTLAATRAKVEEDFHLELIGGIKQKFDAYRAASTSAQQAAAAPEGNGAAPEDFEF